MSWENESQLMQKCLGTQYRHLYKRQPQRPDPVFSPCKCVSASTASKRQILHCCSEQIFDVGVFGRWLYRSSWFGCLLVWKTRCLWTDESVAQVSPRPTYHLIIRKEGTDIRKTCRVLVKSSPNPIRTNAICPWMTETRMVSGIEESWKEAGLPRNKAIDVARVIVGVMVAESLNGEALYVEGGRAWGIEEGIDRTQPQWMGEKQSRDFQKGQEVLGTGENW